MLDHVASMRSKQLRGLCVFGSSRSFLNGVRMISSAPPFIDWLETEYGPCLSD